jgi:hemoglobin
MSTSEKLPRRFNPNAKPALICQPKSRFEAASTFSLKDFTMHRIVSSLLLATCFTLGASLANSQTNPPTRAQPAADDSLYKALGEKAGLTSLMDDFVKRLMSDARIGSFFKDTNPTHLAQQLTEQLCMLSGGPCTYRGVPMKEAHADMDITKADFNALVEALQASMEAKGLPFGVQNRLLARLAPMHREVVTVR